jgi:hypothetical protein
VAVSVAEFLAEENEYLRECEGRDFFLALAPSMKALEGQSEVREVLATLQAEVQVALHRFVTEQNDFIEEAKAIRRDLAKEAPEIDNSDMKQPDRRSHAYSTWDFDSFARFDDLVERDKTLQIGYPLMPDDTVAPGIVSRLLQILSGRLRAAEYGEDASSFDPPIRRDLGDLGLRIRNLGESYDYALRRYRQESRTLPGIAFGRLVSFGSDLNPAPEIIDTDKDVSDWLDKTAREFGTAKQVVRKLVNGQPLNDSWEDRYAADVEGTLKGEARRLHRELLRRIPVSPTTVRVVPGVPLVSGAEPSLTDVAGNDLRFTDFVDLLLARLAEIDRGGPEQYPDLFDAVAALKVDVSDDWIFDAGHPARPRPN